MGASAAPSLPCEPGRLLGQQRRHLHQVVVERPRNTCVTSMVTSPPISKGREGTGDEPAGQSGRAGRGWWAGVTQGELIGRAYQKVREGKEVRLDDGLDLACAKDASCDHKVRFSGVNPWMKEKGLQLRFLRNRFAIRTNPGGGHSSCAPTYTHNRACTQFERACNTDLSHTKGSEG